MRRGLSKARSSVDVISDARTFTQLSEAEYRKELLGFAVRLISLRQEAEDIVTDTYLKVLDKITSVGIAKGALKSYLYRAVRNGTVDYLRSSRRHEKELKETIGDDKATSYFSEVVSEEMIGSLLESLPEDNRLAIMLCDLQELSAQEAADILLISVPALKSRLYRGRKLLRQLLVGLEIVPARCAELSRDNVEKLPKARMTSPEATQVVKPPTPWWYVSDAVRPVPPGDLARLRQLAEEPVEQTEPSADLPLISTAKTSFVDPLTTNRPAKVKQRKNESASFFDGKSPFASSKSLEAAIKAADESWGASNEVSQILRQAGRRRGRQPLPNEMRALIIDMIYERVYQDERKARYWVRRLTAQFPPGPETPDHLYLI